MSKASVHTTIRELSHAISRKESVINTTERDLYWIRVNSRHTADEKKRREAERNQKTKDANVGLFELRQALASLTRVVADGLV